MLKSADAPYKPVSIYLDGMLFKYTQPRHQPGHFCFQDIATRTLPPERKSGRESF